MLLLRLSYLDRTVDLEELIRALGGAPRPGAARAPRRESGGASGRSAAGAPGAGAASAGPSASAATPAARAGLREGSAAAQSAPAAEATQAAQATGPTEPDDIVPSGTLNEAWGRWLDSGRGVPRGLTAFLRSAPGRARPRGCWSSASPPGPAVERLSEPPVSGGRSPPGSRRGWDGRSACGWSRRSLPGAAETPRRISREEVRADTLKALYRKEPRLERAVEELDLELMD